MYYETNLDDLENQLDGVTKPKDRIELLCKRVSFVVDLDLKRAYDLIHELHALSTSGEFARSPHLPGLAWSQFSLGWYYLRLSDHDRALSFFFEAEERFHHLGLPEGQKQAANGIGVVYVQLAQFDSALEYFLKALGTDEDSTEPFLLSGVLNNLGFLYVELGDLDKAMAYLDRSLKASRKIANIRNQSAALDNQSNIYYRQGNYQKALDCALESLSFSRDIKSKIFEAESLNSAGDAYMALGKRKEALDCFQMALEISSEVGHTYEEVEAMIRIGAFYVQDRDFEAAVSLLYPALFLSRKASMKHLEGQCCYTLAELYEAQGDDKLALEHYKLYHDIEKEVFNQLADWRLKTLRVLHQVETDKNLRQNNARLQERLLEIEKLQEQLEELAVRDSLTGLYNRRYLDENLARILAHHKRSGNSLSVVLIDIDLFKKVNDSFGHQHGDEVLIALGKLLESKTRPLDTVYRYGGDEFVVVLPDITPKEALHRSLEWNESFSSQTFEFRGEKRLPLSLSQGIASFPNNASTPDGLFSAADEALYKSKISRGKATLSSRVSKG